MLITEFLLAGLGLVILLLAGDTLVRGADARFAHHEPGDMRLPPDWSGGYTSIFDHQEKIKSGGMM